MKSKFLISSLILSLMISSSCQMVDSYLITDKYKLKDTWGTDGNWGKQSGTAKKPVSHTENKEAAHKPADTHQEAKHEEPKHEEAKNEEAAPEEAKHEEPKHEEAENSEAQAASAYVNEKYGYSLAPAENWQQKDTFGPIGAYYVKEKEGSNLNFSVGVVKNLKGTDIKAKFKEEYLKKLKESFPNLEIKSTKDEDFKGQKAWAINYSFEKNGNKLQQRQVFIPHKDNTLVINWIATEEGFFKGEEDFNAISKNLTFI